MTTRREFLGRSVFTGSALLLGCGGEDASPSGSGTGFGGSGGTGFGGAGGTGHGGSGGAGTGGTGGAGPGGTGPGGQGGAGGGVDCPDPFAGTQYVEDVPFINENEPTLNTPINAGWDGRLYFDHSMLTDETLVVPNEHFYIRTRYPDLLSPPNPWTIRIDGLVNNSFDLSLNDLLPLEQDRGVHLLECSGNAGSGFGLISAAQWSGILMTDVLDMVGVLPAATQVLIEGFDQHSVPSSGGHSKPGASWIFGFQRLVDRGAFLATKMNGVPLPEDHGKPVRLFVPGWYGCCNVKWVDGIRLVDDSEPPTSQMDEFASRTHQSFPTPALAKDWKPARQEFSAMPIRIEKWANASGQVAYRVVGVLWGGYAPTDKLEIQLGSGDWRPVDMCPPQTTNQTWTLWKHRWQPASSGSYSIRLRVNDDVPQLRLDQRWYERETYISEV